MPILVTLYESIACGVFASNVEDGMSKTERWTLGVAIATLILTGVSTWVAVAHEAEHRAGIMYKVIIALSGISLMALNGYAIYRNIKDAHRVNAYRKEIESKKQKLVALVEKRKEAGGQAWLLWSYSYSASGLVRWLEEIWYRWNSSGEVLIYPIGGKTELKNWSGDKSGDLIGERRDFMVLYRDHVTRLSQEIPEFVSATTRRGFPSDDEYARVMADLG